MAPHTRSITKKYKEAARICPSFRYDCIVNPSVNKIPVRVTRSLIRAITFIGLKIEELPAQIRRRRNTSCMQQQPKRIPARRRTDQATEIWCICRRREFGTMIGCDGPQCTIKWFHLSCIGMRPQKIPKDKWFCANCRIFMNT